MFNVLVCCFFVECDVFEVEMLILLVVGNIELNIDSFYIDFIGYVDVGGCCCWLCILLEYLFKCLFVVGVGDCYELGWVFCNGEVGGCYNLEFIMLEWYWVGWDYYWLV